MISILIVDDEPLIRETLAGMLEKRYPGRFHVTLAGDGRQALEYASMLPVRLILADIKMPVLSGLEMLDQLRGLRRDCEVIFISGYDDYAFVRQAMKLGAADYLLKPIVEEELTGQIDSFLKREEVRRAEQPPTPAASAEDPYYEQFMLEQLFARPHAASELLALPPDCRMTVCACECQPDDAEGCPWQDALRQAACDLPGGVLLQGRQEQLRLSAFFCGEGQGEELVQRFEAMDAAQPVPVFAPPMAPERLTDAVEDCRRRLCHRFYTLPGQDGPERYPYTQLTAQMADAVCLFHAAQFDELFRTLMLRACAQTPPVDSLRHILCDLVYTIMQRNPAFVPAISHAELTEDDILRRIRAARDAEQMAGEVTRILHRHMTDVGGKAAALDATHIERAKSFIARNYARNLSLADLADHLALHPNYISALFTKVSGMSFSQYLRHVRIEEACRLIRTTNDKFYLIGERVGYPDPVHFARTFRAEVGCSPKEYRRLHPSGEGGK
ncbi:MAG: response regulator [Eubacteriales bacterium]|nr:response regulator [Eubacteriales bacterium]